MAEGAYAPLNSLMDRSRFRTDFNRPTYTRRDISTMSSSLISDFAPSRRTVKRQLPKTAHLSAIVHVKPKPHATLAMESIASSHHAINMAATPAKAGSFIAPITEAVALDKSQKRHRQLPKSLVFISLKSKNRMQLSLIGLATLMVIAGGYLSFSAWQTNRTAQVQATKLTQQANQAAARGPGSNNTSQALATVKPTPAAMAAYAVAPSLPKYLKIPAIGVDVRVLQVGILASGALGTPSNVFDTDWYTGSAQPGQPGATLIDGHVSSWTSHGVFYNLHNLKPGDNIQIVKGDNSVVNYQVVKTQVYSANDVNMQAAITPITPGTPGLNLITCTGQVIKGTSTFSQRVIVFAQETSS